MVRCAGCVVLLISGAMALGQSRAPREALQPLGDLVGQWRGTGTPFGSREDQQKNFWVEAIACEWKFKGPDVWLALTFEKSKYFQCVELRFVPDKSHYLATVKSADGATQTFTGELDNKILTLTTDDGRERLVVTLLHDNRFLYRKEARLEGKSVYTKLFQVGATKEGVPFASGTVGPECLVSGGKGTSPVTYMGKTYYVCCGGCRDEFNANPAKYVQEFEAKKTKKSQ